MSVDAFPSVVFSTLPSELKEKPDGASHEGFIRDVNDLKFRLYADMLGKIHPDSAAEIFLEVLVGYIGIEHIECGFLHVQGRPGDSEAGSRKRNDSRLRNRNL